VGKAVVKALSFEVVACPLLLLEKTENHMGKRHKQFTELKGGKAPLAIFIYSYANI
jgi:hypothetical protein